MAATDTSKTIVNESLSLMGNNAPEVTGEYPNFDDSPAGVAARNLYGPCVAAVLREFEYEFSRASVSLVLSGNAAKIGFSFEYLYPTSALEIWQVSEATLVDPNNPLPTNWVVGNNVVGSGLTASQKKVIWTDIQSAIAVVNNNPVPSVWDDSVRSVVVRRLASEFAMALAGRPETSQDLLQTSVGAASIARARDG